MWQWIVLALALVQPSFQITCELKVHTLPFSTCENENWGPVQFKLEPDLTVRLPMSSLCNNQSTTSTTIPVTDSTWVRKGYLRMRQLDNGPNFDRKLIPRWFIESIVVVCGSQFKSSFGIGRAVETSRWYDFSNYDTNFKHAISAADQNQAELSSNGQDYIRTPVFENGPMVVKTMNAENSYELFTLMNGPDKSTATKKSMELSLRLLPSIKKMPFFTSIEDVENFIITSGFPIPEAIDYWDADSNFEAQRLQGANPTVIKMTRKIPKNFHLDEERAEDIMRVSLRKQLNWGKIFIADLEILDDINYYAPMALFYLNRKGQFKVLAIQLERNNKNNLVFYPDDNDNAWLMAKLYYNLAESFHHQMVIHLGSTHFFMDGIGSLMYQHLPPSHPVFKIIKPHLYQMFGNNLYGTQKLMKTGGLIDKIMVCGRENAKKLLTLAVSRFDYKEINPILNDKYRHTRTIKVYPYRDHALPIYKTIKMFVYDVLRNYYKKLSPSRDTHLKNWRMALSRSQEDQGASIKNLPGSDKTGAMSFNQLVETVATIIWQASAGHAAIHNPQYAEFAFPLNYPLNLKLPPPSTKYISDADVVKVLPNKPTVLAGTVLAYNFLHDGDGGFIGTFDRLFLRSPRDAIAIKKFKTRLESLSKKKHPNTEYTYKYLDIGTIRNSPRV